MDKAQQYVVGLKSDLVGGGQWAYWGGGDYIDYSAGFNYACSVNGSELIYEISLTMFEWYGGKTGEATTEIDLEPGIAVGFDLVAGHPLGRPPA